jgi:hypothetical protein
VSGSGNRLGYRGGQKIAAGSLTQRVCFWRKADFAARSCANQTRKLGKQ